MLKGRSALITGSTSGIWLGIAETLARAGANVTLNGLGDHDAVEQLRVRLAERHGAEVAYSDADMSRPAQISEMVSKPSRAQPIPK